MYNQEQFDYVKKQLESGMSEAELRKVLADAGYDPPVIDLLLKDAKEEVFRATSNTAPVEEVDTRQNSHKPLNVSHADNANEPQQTADSFGQFAVDTAEPASGSLFSKKLVIPVVLGVVGLMVFIIVVWFFFLSGSGATRSAEASVVCGNVNSGFSLSIDNDGEDNFTL